MRLRFSRPEWIPALALGVLLVVEAVIAGRSDWTLLVSVSLAAVTAVALVWRIRLPVVTLAVALHDRWMACVAPVWGRLVNKSVGTLFSSVAS